MGGGCSVRKRETFYLFSASTFFSKKKNSTSTSTSSTSTSLDNKITAGATYPLPEGYAVYVLPKDQKSSIDERAAAAATAPEASTSEAEEDLLGLGAPTCWKAAAAAAAVPASSSSAPPPPPPSALTDWKLDEHPTPQDGQRRALDWVGTARAVAARVSREEVDRALKAMMMKE